MTTCVRLTDIKFTDGTSVSVGPTDTIVFVGPNNCGKSTILRELFWYLESPGTNRRHCVESATIAIPCTLQELLSRLETEASNVAGTGNRRVFQGIGWEYHETSAAGLCDAKEVDGIDKLARVLCCQLITGNRLQITKPPEQIRFREQPYGHPIHHLQFDDKIERKISAAVQSAFGCGITVNRNAGAVVPLHFGDPPPFGNDEDRVSPGYIEKVMALPPVFLQGDGVRSYIGVLLEATVRKRDIVLVDEPEAFLHPPQARQLGKYLKKYHDRESQLFVATHSGDVIQGMLEAGAENLKIVRVTRDGNAVSLKILNSDAIAQLWKDSLLRHSNILDGLFHRKVIVCESDTDCRFYSAIASAIDPEGVKASDVLFVHCGGKSRVHNVASALRAAGVPVCAVCDFDVLRERSTIERIVGAVGGDWPSLMEDWKTVVQSIDGKKSTLSSDELKRQIEMICNETSNRPNLSKAGYKAVEDLLKKASEWDVLKRGGVSVISGGEPSAAAKRLLSRLDACGLHVVEVGELERFDRSVSMHGTAWVNAVLQKDLAADPDLAEAREFVKKMIA